MAIVEMSAVLAGEGCLAVQNTPAAGTFSRSSVAYKSDGTQVAVDEPRFETGKFGQAVMVEEGALYLSFGMIAAINSYLWVDMSSVTDYIIQSGDYIEYDIFWPTNTPTLKRIAFDFICSDETSLRDSGAVDQNGLSAHPYADLTAYASGKWYHRKIAIPSTLVGKTITYFDLACEYDGGGTVAGMIRNIRITDGGTTVRKSIWASTDALPSFTVHLNSNTSQTYSFSKVEAESLTIPTAGVFVKGSWTKEFYFIPTSAQIVAGKTGYLWECYIDANNYYVLKVGPDGKPYLEVKSGGTLYQTSTTSAPVLAVGSQYSFALRGNGSLMALFCNGTKISEVSYVEPVGTLPANQYLGCDHNGANHANGLYDDYRDSSIARTDAETAAAYQSGQPLPADRNTTYLARFDGTLASEPLPRSIQLTRSYGATLAGDSGCSAVAALMRALEVAFGGDASLSAVLTPERLMQALVQGGSDLSAAFNLANSLQTLLAGGSSVAGNINLVESLQGVLRGDANLTPVFNLVRSLQGTLQGGSALDSSLITAALVLVLNYLLSVADQLDFNLRGDWS